MMIISGPSKWRDADKLLRTTSVRGADLKKIRRLFRIGNYGFIVFKYKKFEER